MEDSEGYANNVPCQPSFGRTSTTIGSLPNVEFSSLGSLPFQVPEESPPLTLAQEVLEGLYPMLTTMEENLMAELEKLRREFERWRAQDPRQTGSESNGAPLTSPTFAWSGASSAPFAIAEDAQHEKRTSHSSTPLEGESDHVVQPECLHSGRKSGINAFDQKHPNPTLVDPLSLSFGQLESIHSNCLLAEASDGAGASIDYRGSFGNRKELCIGPKDSSWSDHKVEEEPSGSSKTTTAYLRRLEASWIGQEQEMIQSRSCRSYVSELGSLVGSRTRFEQACIRRVLVLGAVLPSGYPPLDTIWYRFGSTLTVLLGIASAVSLTVLEPYLFHEYMSFLVLSLGVTIGLISIRKAQNLIGPNLNPIGAYAADGRIERKVASASARRMALISLAWPTTISLYVVQEVLWGRVSDDDIVRGRAQTPGLAALSIFSHIFVSGFFIAVLLCLIHILTALEVIINQFVAKFFINPNCNNVFRDWNRIHCLLRRTSRSMDTAFLAIVTSASIAIVLHIIRGVELRQKIFKGNIFNGIRGAEVVLLLAMVPPFVLFASAIYCLAKAAHITELCKRLPPLVNSFGVDEHHDKRTYAVQYIAFSDAGFYLKGVKLSPSFILKVFYVLGAIVFGMMTTLMSILSA